MSAANLKGKYDPRSFGGSTENAVAPGVYRITVELDKPISGKELYNFGTDTEKVAEVQRKIHAYTQGKPFELGAFYKADRDKETGKIIPPPIGSRKKLRGPKFESKFQKDKSFGAYFEPGAFYWKLLGDKVYELGFYLVTKKAVKKYATPSVSTSGYPSLGDEPDLGTMSLIGFLTVVSGIVIGGIMKWVAATTAGAAVLGFFGWPVILTFLVIAAITMAAYYAWQKYSPEIKKWVKEKKDELEKVFKKPVVWAKFGLGALFVGGLLTLYFKYKKERE